MIFIQENAFEYVVCEMTVILWRPECVNKSIYIWTFPIPNIECCKDLQNCKEHCVQAIMTHGTDVIIRVYAIIVPY